MRIDDKALTRALWNASITQRELAERAGFSEGYVSEILAGRVRGNPRTAGRLAKALQVDVADIVTDDDAEPQAVAQ